MDPKDTTTPAAAKATPKQRATSTPRAPKPAGKPAPVPAKATTPAPKPRLRFLPGQCHFRNEAGRAVCKEPRPADKPSHLLCDTHEALWHAGKLRLTQAGTVRLMARLEAQKLDPTMKTAKKSTPKPAAKPARKTGTKPAQVAKIPAQNTTPKLPEATVAKVD